ncbi:MAG: hypothetical protein ACJAZW_002916 [Maritalea sp.]|jgi:hypothetical protein
MSSAVYELPSFDEDLGAARIIGFAAAGFDAAAGTKFGSLFFFDGSSPNFPKRSSPLSMPRLTEFESMCEFRLPQ